MQTAGKPRGIKGVTDSPRPPVVAKAKIGRKTEKGYPEKLDYIIFVEPGENGPEIETFRVLGDKPTSFLAAFPSDDTESFVDAAWKRYGKSGVKCRGDGERGVDRETGEEVQCAGEYNKDNPAAHLCPYDRPTQKNGKTYPPECKPSVSVRLVVPLAGAMGLVQLDTGGVSSSVPTLWWQLDQLSRMSGGQLAGVAIKVGIRAFTTAHGISYAWHLETPSPEELATLKRDFERLAPVRVIDRAAIPAAKELPPMSEAIDQDVYGLPDEAVLPQIEAPADEAAYEEPTTQSFGIPGDAMQAELVYRAALKASTLPQGKRDSAIATMEYNRAKSEREDSWDGYLAWITAATDRIPGAES